MTYGRTAKDMEQQRKMQWAGITGGDSYMTLNHNPNEESKEQQ